MIEDWVNATVKSIKQVAADMGFNHCEASGSAAQLPKGLPGSFVPLVGQGANIQIGVMSSREGHEKLARVVLQCEPDESIERDDIADAVGELANCVAGRLKREMRATDPTLKIGLPVFIDGTVEDVGRAEQRTLSIVMNGVEVSLLLVVGG